MHTHYAETRLEEMIFFVNAFFCFNFLTQYFFYTFFDTGLCTSLGQMESSVVLAGDPKQLDAVTKSDYAIQMGFQTSFMERLFEKSLYKRNSVTDQYNSKYITQLVKNYRSHPAILAIPNQLFYDNKLKPTASKGKWRIFLIQFQMHLHRKNGIIFENLKISGH